MISKEVILPCAFVSDHISYVSPIQICTKQCQLLKSLSLPVGGVQ
jgi:hypothetical protein